MYCKHSLLPLALLAVVAGSPYDIPAEELKLRKTLRHSSGLVVRIAFSPDGKTLLSAGALDNIIRLWNVESGEHAVIQASHTVSIRSGLRDAAFSPNGRIVASSGIDQKIVLWDVATRMPVRTLAFEKFNIAQALAFSPDGKLLATGNAVAEFPLSLWDVASGKMVASLAGHETEVLSVAFSPGGKLLVSGASSSTKAGIKTLKLWDVDAAKSIYTFEELAHVKALAVSPDGKTLAAESFVGVPQDFEFLIKLWDIESGKLAATLGGFKSGVECITFSPDGKWLASGDRGPNLIVWDVASGKELTRNNLWEKGGEAVRSVAFSPDGKTLASVTSPGGKGVIKLWDVESLKE